MSQLSSLPSKTLGLGNLSPEFELIEIPGFDCCCSSPDIEPVSLEDLVDLLVDDVVVFLTDVEDRGALNAPLPC